MTDLEELILPDEPAREATALVGAAALEVLVPVVGPALARTLDAAMAERASRRNREFQVAVVREIRSVWESLSTKPNLEDVLTSDRFLASYAQASRAASETASEAKRARLARAAATASLPTGFASQIEINMQFVERYDDLRVWLLAFYQDPEGWLRANGKEWAAADGIRGGKRDEPLNAALGSDASRRPSVRDAIEDLQGDMMLGTFDLGEVVSDRRQFKPQTRRRGRRLLEFIRATPLESVAPDPPF